MAVVAGLSEQRLAKIAGGLEAFAGEVFDGALVRSEQRKCGGAYMRGLMLDGRRKSIEPMAARLADGDEQGLQQFVNQSPWDERVVRANLARRMVGEIAPEMWVIDDTGFVKKGRFSVGVGRQYSGTLGRVDNCQVGGPRPGQTAEVDWGQAEVELAGARTRVHLFFMRSCLSGAAFSMASPVETQQAFLEGHAHAFSWFDGVFAEVRYDNLTSAVKQVLKGRRRVESDRFVAMRSH